MNARSEFESIKAALRSVSEQDRIAVIDRVLDSALAKASLALVQNSSFPKCASDGSAAKDRAFQRCLEEGAPDQAELLFESLPEYEVIEVLGHGGMGAVYKAKQKKLDRFVAIKVMLGDLTRNKIYRERFLREGRAAANLIHPHIVVVHHADEIGATPYLVMEFVDGETLEAYLKRKSKLALAEIARIGCQITQGLAFAHSKDLVHRDITLRNLMIHDEVIKIVDFGLAKLLNDDDQITGPGDVIGTPMYIAPERWKGDPGNAACDLFSLGVVLYQMCANAKPFAGKERHEIRDSMLKDNVTPACALNPDVPHALSVLIGQLLRTNPSDRPKSAVEVLNRLQVIEKSLTSPIEAPPPHPSDRPQSAAEVHDRLQETEKTLTSPIDTMAPKQSRKGLFIGIGAVPTALVCAVVACVLIFKPFDVVKRDDRNGDKPNAPDQQGQQPIAAGNLGDGVIPNSPSAPKGPNGSVVVAVRHLGEIHAAAYASDGKLLATGGDDGVVRLWRPDEDGCPLDTALVGHTEWVTNLAWSKDGAKLLSAGSDGFRVWKIGKKSGCILQVAAAGIVRATLSPDGQQVACIRNDPHDGDGNVVELYDTDKGAKGHVVKGMQFGLLAFSPDSKSLAAAPYNGNVIKLYLRETGAETAELKDENAKVANLAFAPDGKSLLAVEREHKLRIWDVATRKLKGAPRDLPAAYGYSFAWFPPGIGALKAPLHECEVQPGLTAHILCCHGVLSPHGTTYYAITDTPLRRDKGLYRCKDGSMIAGLDSTGRVYPQLEDQQILAWSDDCRRAATATDRAIHLWDAETGAVTATIPVTGRPRSIGFAPNGAMLSVLQNDGRRVALWHVAPRKSAGYIEAPATGFRSVGWARPGSATLICSDDKTIGLFDAFTHKRTTNLDRAGRDMVIQRTCTSPDGKFMAAVEDAPPPSNKSEMTFTEIASGKIVDVTPGRGGLTRVLSWSPNSRFAAYLSHDRKRVQFWDSANRHLAKESIDLPSDHCDDLCWLDDKTIAACMWVKGHCQLLSWDFSDVTKPPTLTTGPSRGQFAPNGRTLVTWIPGGMRFWNTKTGQLRATVLLMNNDQWLASDGAGHIQFSEAVDQEMVFVTGRTDDVETHTLKHFATQFPLKQKKGVLLTGN